MNHRHSYIHNYIIEYGKSRENQRLYYKDIRKCKKCGCCDTIWHISDFNSQKTQRLIKALNIDLSLIRHKHDFEICEINLNKLKHGISFLKFKKLINGDIIDFECECYYVMIKKCKICGKTVEEKKFYHSPNYKISNESQNLNNQYENSYSHSHNITEIDELLKQTPEFYQVITYEHKNNICAKTGNIYNLVQKVSYELSDRPFDNRGREVYYNVCSECENVLNEYGYSEWEYPGLGKH